MGIPYSVFCRRKSFTVPLAEGVGSGRAPYDATCGGLGHLVPVGRRRRRWRRWRGGCGRENKSWLLAEAAGGGPAVAEPGSMHSSFRFSFGSQAEAEAEAPPVAAATVLMLVSMEDEGGEAAGRRELDVAVPAFSDRQRRLESLERSIAPVAGVLVRFSYSEIRLATRDFCRGWELGRGALSRVYKGKIGSGLRRPAVAIKRLEGIDRETAKAFCRELMIASSLSCPYVVPLLGFCIDREGLFLVYKYVSGRSLDIHLHQNEKRGKVLPWEVRYNVGVGVAQAMEYLHFGTDRCVVHRDIKPSNILLSSKKNPMLCDFGLATWTHGPSLPFLCKAVKGTFGYLAPEYIQNGKLSDKTDVYALGVVLLELITGRKALDHNRPKGDENLVAWAKPLLLQGKDSIGKLVDPKLTLGSYSWKEMCRMVGAASACLIYEDSTRPSMDRILAILLGEENEWSLFRGNSSLAGYVSPVHEHEQQAKCDMGAHLALAMLGVSDNEKDDVYGR